MNQPTDPSTGRGVFYSGSLDCLKQTGARAVLKLDEGRGSILLRLHRQCKLKELSRYIKVRQQTTW